MILSVIINEKGYLKLLDSLLFSRILIKIFKYVRIFIKDYESPQDV